MVEAHPEKRLIGFARVSTYGQTLDSQLEQLRAAGCTSRNIYREKVTGAHSDRRELLKMLKALAPGDVVTVTRIDRLARSALRPVRHRQAHRGTPRRNSGHWRSRGPTPAPAPDA
jgi:DNA invertase Pin-like site-specific DNA recombinase